MTGPPAVSCLVLAAGDSRRMPGPSKLARPFGDTSVLGAVVRAARDGGAETVAVVSRSDAEVPDVPIDILVPVEPGGRADSLAAGLGELPPGAVVVLLGDEPGIRPDAIARIAEFGRSFAGEVARVRYRDRPGHPVWLSARGRAHAARLSGDTSVWDRLSERDRRAAELAVPFDAPIDVDTPEALRRARAALDGPVSRARRDGP